MHPLTLDIVGKPDAHPMVLARFGEYCVAEDVRFTQSARRRIEQFIADLESFVVYAEPDVSEERLREMGKLLFHLLFHRDVKSLYDHVLGAAQGGLVRVDIGCAAAFFQQIPWEFLFDSERDEFVGAGVASIVRHIIGLPPLTVAPPPPPSTLRILIAVASPTTQEKLDWEEEQRVVLRPLQPLVQAGLAEVTVRQAVTPALLHAEILRGGYRVLHFIGHGGFRGERAALLLERGDGGEQWLDAQKLGQMLMRRGVDLVVLNACEGATVRGRVRTSDFNVAIAPALVARGVRAVMANQYSVPDQGALRFSEIFYTALASGYSIDEAMLQARLAMTYADEAYVVDWGIPVLYTNQSGVMPAASLLPFKGKDILLTLPAPSAPASTPAPRAAEPPPAAVQRLATPTAPAPRETAKPSKTILLADLDAKIGYLDKIAERLNAAQDYFRFEPTLFAYPAGCLTEFEGLPQFRAHRIESQARQAVAQLKAHLLVAFTRWLVTDDEWFNLFAAGSDKHSVISVKDLRQYATRAGRTFEYAIAYALAAQLLVTYEAQMDYHDDTNACLLDFCENRADIVKGLKAGKLQDCCRPKVKNKRLLKAVENILAEPFEGLREVSQ